MVAGADAVTVPDGAVADAVTVAEKEETVGVASTMVVIVAVSLLLAGSWARGPGGAVPVVSPNVQKNVGPWPSQLNDQLVHCT